MTEPQQSHGHGSDEPIDWDTRYAESERLWSGDPNGTLIDSVRDLAPGRALDVGCGEGGDAVWLAQNGRRVTALDVSAVALERAARHASQAGVSVEWLHAGLLEADIRPSSFDLVSAQYTVLAKTSELAAEHILLDAVAPGGTLVIVHHADFQNSREEHHGTNPADYVDPWDVAPLLGDGWSIEVNETRPRQVASGAGASHTEDVVLVARRATS